jgi:Aminoglycoside adenylyltransferase, C-terminal domain
VSDIDLIAAMTDAPDAPLVTRLHQMHAGIVEADPEWDGRIEVDYVSTRGLAECRTRTTTIARISPGEPLHLVEAGRDFLLDWYPARRDGVALVGPPLESLIPPIPEREYRDEVLAYLAGFRDRFDEDAGVGSQAYAMLTMCRGFYSMTARERLSKREAGLRARRELPRWGPLINRALDRRDRQWDRVTSRDVGARAS